VSGEDFQLTYGLRRYANIYSFVMPTHSDADYNGFSHDYSAISALADSSQERKSDGKQWRQVPPALGLC
jgi:hypothetical protein